MVNLDILRKMDWKGGANSIQDVRKRKEDYSKASRVTQGGIMIRY